MPIDRRCGSCFVASGPAVDVHHAIARPAFRLIWIAAALLCAGCAPAPPVSPSLPESIASTVTMPLLLPAPDRAAPDDPSDCHHVRANLTPMIRHVNGALRWPGCFAVQSASSENLRRRLLREAVPPVWSSARRRPAEHRPSLDRRPADLYGCSPPAGYPSGLRGRIANPLFVGSNPTPAFPSTPAHKPNPKHLTMDIGGCHDIGYPTNVGGPAFADCRWGSPAKVRDYQWNRVRPASGRWGPLWWASCCWARRWAWARMRCTPTAGGNSNCMTTRSAGSATRC